MVPGRDEPLGGHYGLVHRADRHGRRPAAFEHELGDFYGNAALPWAETFDLNLTSGAQLITVKQMIPDVDGDASGLLVFAVLS